MFILVHLPRRIHHGTFNTLFFMRSIVAGAIYPFFTFNPSIAYVVTSNIPDVPELPEPGPRPDIQRRQFVLYTEEVSSGFRFLGD